MHVYFLLILLSKLEINKITSFIPFGKSPIDGAISSATSTFQNFTYKYTNTVNRGATVFRKRENSTLNT